MKKLTAILFLALSYTVTTQSQSWWSSKKVTGNGTMTTETRNVQRFDKVSVGGSFDVVLTDGNEGKITIEGEENIIPYVETEVHNGKLKINFKNNTNIRTTRKLLVTVAFNELESVSLGGSGNVKVTKEISNSDVSFSVGGSGNISALVGANNVKASIGGSGNIKLEGKTNDFKCSIGGSGNVKAYELKANNLKASIAGSGSIQTHVTSNIKASIVGSGSIYYKGKPNSIDTTSLGSGDVVNKN
ncbi:head GIN domain-containing protein [Tenacibaculum sp. TC6]|uniref:head GIN domain-containing protein n=1 Tax=Tenacibaculum sp. TC6 TaxID=3423223 RepID=UPI003D369A01